MCCSCSTALLLRRCVVGRALAIDIGQSTRATSNYIRGSLDIAARTSKDWNHDSGGRFADFSSPSSEFL
jgi:hypothetical protein